MRAIPPRVDCLRIAMWSGPRNISTAMMRSFENRPDSAVVDEPLYAAYLAATGIDHPGRAEILHSQNADWRAVMRDLTTATPAPVYYQKHMCQHWLAGFPEDVADGLTNCFLIREPRRIIASYARVRSAFVIDELGFRQQKRLFDRECDRLGEAPPVLDAALTLQDPRGVLTRLCGRVGIPFDEGMLAWRAGPRDSDGVWAPHWYASVWQSTGFAPPPPFDTPPTLPAPLEAMCEEATTCYEAMRPYAIAAGNGGDRVTTD